MPRVSIEELVTRIRDRGELGSFPTDTLPALACRPDCAKLIYAAKRRPLDKPLILMAADSADLWIYVQGSAQERQLWQEMADRYWPGALTLVLPASNRVPADVHPTEPTTIGLRVPNHALAQRILTDAGVLATTSANYSGEPALLTMAAIAKEFPEVLIPASVSEADEAVSGQASTVIRWRGDRWIVLRQGAVVVE